MRRLPSQKTVALLVLLSLPLACSTGCAVLYQLAYGGGHKIEAKYQGLKGQRVAVVCVMNPSTYGDGATSTVIADRVERILAQQSGQDSTWYGRMKLPTGWTPTTGMKAILPRLDAA